MKKILLVETNNGRSRRDSSIETKIRPDFRLVPRGMRSWTESPWKQKHFSRPTQKKYERYFEFQSEIPRKLPTIRPICFTGICKSLL